MAKPQDELTEQLARIEARLDRLANAAPRGGLLGALRPLTLGALVGAGVALLYAPQAGQQTRTTLRENADKLQGQAAETANVARARVQRATNGAGEPGAAPLPIPEQAKDTIKAATANVRDGAQAAKANAKRGAQGAGEALGQTAGRAPIEEAQARLRQDLASGRENPA